MKKVLIIEDDPIVGKIYASRLEKEGYQPEIAADGQQGFYRISDWKPDAVLLDLMLPKMNGLDVLKKIRAVKALEKLPILVFTNAYITTMIREATDAGASFVFNKANTTPRQILDTLTSVLAPAAAAPPNAPAEQPAQSREPVENSEARQAIASSARGWIADMRRSLLDLNKTTDAAARSQHLDVLFQKLGSFSSNAGLAGLKAAARLSAATQALAKELLDKPRHIGQSTLRTLAQALDSLDELAHADLPVDIADQPPIHILVADDDTLSRRAVTLALEKASLGATAVDSAAGALEKAAVAKYDLVLLDINMPGMSGFEVCDRLRQIQLNQATPVIFVTSNADFQARAQSTLRGASDLIAKPFLFIELTVCALTTAIRHRADKLRKASRQPALTTSSSSPVAAPAATVAEVIL